MNVKKIRWISITEYVDIETGEIITKSKFEREYIKLKSNKKIEKDEKYGYIKWTIECERDRQTKLAI